MARKFKLFPPNKIIFRLQGVGEISITREDRHFNFLENILPKLGKLIDSNGSIDTYELPWYIYYDVEILVLEQRQSKFERFVDIIRDIVWDFSNPHRRRRKRLTQSRNSVQ